MVLSIILCCLFVQNCLAMDIPFEPLAPRVDWIGQFQPSEQAKKYEVLAKRTKSRAPTDLPLEKQYAFEDCIDLTRADHLNLDTLKYILEDVALVQAVIAYAPHYTRNGFIELFFAGSLLYEKVDAYTFFLDHHVYNTDIRLGGYNETPAEFVRSLAKKIKVD